MKPKTIIYFLILLQYQTSSQPIKTHSFFTKTNSFFPAEKSTCITTDNNNNIWVGTLEGVYVFDGKKWSTFQNINIKGKKVLSIAVDSKNTKYIGTTNGLVVVEGNKIKKHLTQEKTGKQNKIRQIAIDKKNRKWLATETAIILFDPTAEIKFKRKIKSKKEKNFISIAIEENEQETIVWAGTNNGLYCLKNDVWKKYDNKNTPIPDNHIWSLLWDNGVLWIGTKKGLIKKDQEEWSLLKCKKSPVKNKEIRSLAKDHYDRLWVATEKGFFSYDGIEWGNEKNIKKTPNLVFVDRKDNKWVSTEKGILVYNKEGIDFNQDNENKKNTLKINTHKEKTKISYYLKESAKVELKIISLQGREITTIVNEPKTKGNHDFYYNTKMLKKGAYFCTLQTDKQKQMKKLVVMK